jgi:hypothetical protein
MYLLQDDIAKYVSEPASPPRLVNVPEEGKGKEKERREVGKVTTPSSSRIRPTRKTGRRCRNDSSCGPDSAALDYPTCPLSTISD